MSYDFLHYEAEIVQDWPDEMQGFVDKGIVEVIYDSQNNPHFRLTELGLSVMLRIDLGLN